MNIRTISTNTTRSIELNVNTNTYTKSTKFEKSLDVYYQSSNHISDVLSLLGNIFTLKSQSE